MNARGSSNSPFSQKKILPLFTMICPSSASETSHRRIGKGANDRLDAGAGRIVEARLRARFDPLRPRLEDDRGRFPRAQRAREDHEVRDHARLGEEGGDVSGVAPPALDQGAFVIAANCVGHRLGVSQKQETAHGPLLGRGRAEAQAERRRPSIVTARLAAEDAVDRGEAVAHEVGLDLWREG